MKKIVLGMMIVASSVFADYIDKTEITGVQYSIIDKRTEIADYLMRNKDWKIGGFSYGQILLVRAGH